MIPKKKTVTPQKATSKAQPRRIKVNIAKRQQSKELARASESLLRTIAENYPNSYISIIEKDLTIGYTAGQEFKKLNLDPNQFVGLTLEQVFGKHTPLVRENYLKTFGGVETQFELFINNQHQFYRTVPLMDQAGRITRILAVVENITERKRAEETLRFSEERYRNFIGQSFEAISRTEFDHPIDITLPVEEQIDRIYENAYMAECNQAMADMYHAPSPEAFIGMRLIDAHGGKDNPVNRETFRKLIENGYRSVNDETMEYTVDGKLIWFLSNTIGTVENGYLVRLWGSAIDITARKQAEEKLRESEERLRLTTDNLPNSYVYQANYNDEGQIQFLYISNGVAQLHGVKAEELVADRFIMLEQIEQDQIPAMMEANAESFRTMTDFAMDLRYRLPDGEQRWLHARSRPHRNEKGQVIWHGSVTDITERKRTEEALRAAHETLQTQFYEINALKETLQEQVIRDPLTHLHNRRYLDETLGHEVARARRENYPIGIILMDIDHFKEFNDTYGHSVGDEVLKSLSRLLVNSIRQGDIACRYGGEEFLIVMIGAYEADVERRAEAICRDFSGLRIRFDKQELSATVSVGVAFYPRHGAEIQQVISTADGAMYQAKQAGRNCVQVWHNL